jgi:hypothetical protein
MVRTMRACVTVCVCVGDCDVERPHRPFALGVAIPRARMCIAPRLIAHAATKLNQGLAASGGASGEVANSAAYKELQAQNARLKEVSPGTLSNSCSWSAALVAARF